MLPSSFLQNIYLVILHLPLVFSPFKNVVIHALPSMPPVVTVSPAPTVVPSPSVIDTPLPSPTQIPTPLPTLSPTPVATIIPTIVPTSTPIPEVSASPSVIPTPTPVPSISPSPTASASALPSASPSFIPSPSPTPVPSVSPTPLLALGNDISYPQCNKTYPSGQKFGIVGINGGLASTTNPCLASELEWAFGTPDSGIGIAKIQLYVNTGNPGGLNTASWPHTNTDPEGHEAVNPYGNCDGSNSKACAWQYGWNRAVDDVVSRFVPAAQSVGISSDPANYPWWLDVETANSWREGSDEDLAANAATLEAMVSYFKQRGISVGLYSTHYQWGKIVGNLTEGSNLNGLANWLPGAANLDEAKANCQKGPFTAKSEIVLTQFTEGEFDYDYYCKP